MFVLYGVRNRSCPRRSRPSPSDEAALLRHCRSHAERLCDSRRRAHPHLPATHALKKTNKFAALAVGVILLVAIMALASLQIIRQIESVADIRKNSFNILMRAEALMSDLVDAETGQRGFLVTGDVTYLEPYTPANDRIRSRLEELRPFASTPIAKKHVDVLTPLVDAQLQYMAHTIASRQRNDMSTSVITANLAPGKQLMDSIRSEFRTFIQEEEEVLAQHDIALHSSMRRLPILTVVACLFTLLLALFFAYLIYRESKHEVKNLLHLETQRLLDVQEDVNRQLIQANTTLHVSEEKLAVTL
ncbi:MAG TPA: CHASE3 domain-containing protein, partial [Burkholderiales bacterium]|nr:CHASE3 domain-containing protein [Burkholderiales bacterium]